VLQRAETLRLLLLGYPEQHPRIECPVLRTQRLVLPWCCQLLPGELWAQPPAAVAAAGGWMPGQHPARGVPNQHPERVVPNQHPERGLPSQHPERKASEKCLT
jgi:hypothetical protein